MTRSSLTTVDGATVSLEQFEAEMEHAILGLECEGCIPLASSDLSELLAEVQDSDLTAQHLREVARLFDQRARMVGDAQYEVGDWSAMSPYAKLKHLVRFADNDVREKLLEVAEELHFQSLADLEEAAYRAGDISRGTLVERLVKFADGDEFALQWLRTESRFAHAWHEDRTEFLSDSQQN
jgi:hypothetical protein